MAASKPTARSATAHDTTPFVAEFTHAKDTKGAVQYQQDPPPNGKRAEIGSLYLTKEELALHRNTGRIRVTVEFIG